MIQRNRKSKNHTMADGPNTKKTKTKKKGCLWMILVAVVMCGAGAWIFQSYRIFFNPNVHTPDGKEMFICIPTGSDFSTVVRILNDSHALSDQGSFETVSQKKNYEGKVKPGRYRIVDGMSNNALVNLLRSGKQEPVRVIIQNVKSPEELAGRVSAQIEADSSSVLALFRDASYLSEFGVNPATVFSLIVPDTYQFYWNTSADQFIRRMFKERQRFWSDSRLTKLGETGLDIPEVITLASIVEKETAKNAEKPVIAGVYMNRLRKGWPLQADPTLIFAWNDYSIRRVLNKHKEIDSPYNTYTHTGLPPGPICLPSIASIDAVLNYDKTPYLYFCAKEDLSGYHNFAVTLAQHNRNAERYQAALRRNNIR
jgi:UPF0755 protein